MLSAYLFSLAAVAFILTYAANDLGWSGVQMFAAGWIVWDIAGGVIGHSRVAIKRKRQAENDDPAPWHHNLLQFTAARCSGALRVC